MNSASYLVKPANPATAALEVWGLWLSMKLPDEAETSDGMMVAIIQAAITIGAGLGVIVFDTVGLWAPFAFGFVLLTGSGAFTLMALINGLKNIINFN
ncbi:hypothetical protein MXF40_03500 [Serratia marcescens]|uniref:hypothetical protein n=1 Tax=Serratia marcescens TaxID=615 RepID=UPI002DBD7931|nr:hypothetical protein [Serratia marcescens]MEB6080433.1 hypothetical protein [Serratia marcescens]